MPAFVRKNMLVVQAGFVAADGSNTQPTNVVATVAYTNTAGAAATANFPLAYNSDDNLWTGEWDTSVVQAGEVDWMVFGSGAIQAAAQGSLEILANQANVS
jgi:hypothetical protein